MRKIQLLVLSCFSAYFMNAQSDFDENQMGAWYMAFWNTSFNETKLGLQGDVQFRNWDLGGDLEQLLLRAGVTYSPVPEVKLTLGYGNITSGTFGDSKKTVNESRIYQEALIPQKIGSRFYFTHRFRYEQRWTTAKNIRTRYRYNLFLNVPLNMKELKEGALYLALYNELFINGQRSIGDGESVEFYDRNRFYSAAGYVIKPNLKLQLGWMQQTTNTWSKDQIQLSAHFKF